MKTKMNKFDLKPTNEEGVFEGYASVFNVLDCQNEKVLPGAFKKALDLKGTKMLWQHDFHKPIGVWEEIKEDGHGLYVKGRLLLDLPKAREIHTLLKAGVIDGLSIGYRVKKSHLEKSVRVLKEVELLEISLVTFAANPKAKILGFKEQFSLERQFIKIQKVLGKLTITLREA